MNDEQDYDFDPLGSPEKRQREEEIASELLRPLLAMSKCGQAKVCTRLVQNEPGMYVAIACLELGVSNMMESIADWCGTMRGVEEYQGHLAFAAVYQWRETLLRAFRQALDGPPIPGRNVITEP